MVCVCVLVLEDSQLIFLSVCPFDFARVERCLSVAPYGFWRLEAVFLERYV